MISGAHAIIYSKNPETDREFLRDVLKLPYVDAGSGWLIFGLPPAEVAVHPADSNDFHELYLICEDIQGFIQEMARQGVETSEIHKQEWGLLIKITLPGGGKLGIYEPRHARPHHMQASGDRH